MKMLWITFTPAKSKIAYQGLNGILSRKEIKLFALQFPDYPPRLEYDGDNTHKPSYRVRIAAIIGNRAQCFRQSQKEPC